MPKLKSSISKSSTCRQPGEFRDTHDLSEFRDKTRPASFDVAMESETTYYAVDMKLSEEVEAIARKRGVAADMLINLLDLKERHGVISPRRAARIRDHLTRAIALSGKIVDPGKVDDALREEIFNLNTLDLVCDKHELDWPIREWKLNVRKIVKLLFTSDRNEYIFPFSFLKK